MASLSAAAADPAEDVLNWLAHSAVCSQQDDVASCDAALVQAQTLAAASGDEELLTLVDALRELRAAASRSGAASPGVRCRRAP